MTHSYDFFDTLVTRTCLVPKDLFWFVGNHARQLTQLEPEAFMQLRTDAEVRARKLSSHEEITLQEIYEELNKMLKLQPDVLNQLMLTELEMESSFIKPVAHRSIPDDFIILSDTYLPAAFIQELADKNGNQPKKIFASSAYRKMKHFGGLFDLASAEFTFDTHTGDNAHADVHMPSSKGMHTQYFTAAHATDIETEIYEDITIPFPQRTLLSGCMRAARVSEFFEDNASASIYNIGASVVGPFLFHYTWFVLTEATKRGITDLYFVARDGQILYQLAQLIKQQQNLKIELHYLYGSRKAWHLPSVEQVDERVLDWLFDPTLHLSLKEVCKRASIDIDIVSNLLQHKFDKDIPLTASSRHALKQQFQEQDTIKQLIFDSAAEKRHTVLQYLKQEGFAKHKQIGIVDVGWRGRQQGSLSHLLQSGNLYPEKGVTGFYVALPQAVNPYGKDCFVTFFDKHKDAGLLQRLFMYEIFVAADHGSCIGYKQENGTIVPVLREQVNTTMMKWGLPYMQQGILQFAALYGEKLASSSVSHIKAYEAATKLLSNFFYFPTKDQASAFTEIKVYEDQEETIAYAICTKVSALQMIKYLCGIRSHGIHYNTWIEGAVALSFSTTTAKWIQKLMALKFKVLTLLR